MIFTLLNWQSLYLDRNMVKVTCNPSLMFLVTAPAGKTVLTWGMMRELTTPPFCVSIEVSCRIRVTMAKYLGKSDVMIRMIRRLYNSSALSRSIYDRNWARWNSVRRTMRTETCGKMMPHRSTGFVHCRN